MITALRRYERWYKYQKTAPWLNNNPEGFEISKGHMFDHTAAFAVLCGWTVGVFPGQPCGTCVCV